jgi:hypothetical protein
LHDDYVKLRVAKHHSSVSRESASGGGGGRGVVPKFEWRPEENMDKARVR